jgi:hypothetical protein
MLLSAKAQFNIILGSQTLLFIDQNSARIYFFTSHRIVLIVIKLSPCVTKHYATKTYGRVDAEIHVFLKLTLVGRKWWASISGRLTPEKRNALADWIGDWVGRRGGLNDVLRRKFLPRPGLELLPLGPARSQSLYRLRYRGSQPLWRKRRSTNYEARHYAVPPPPPTPPGYFISRRSKYSHHHSVWNTSCIHVFPLRRGTEFQNPCKNKGKNFLYLEFRTMDEAHKPSNSECCKPSSEPFALY